MSGVSATINTVSSGYRVHSAARRFWVGTACFFAFIVVWTVFLAIAHGAQAINDDTAEAFVWGRQFEWGYWKHPPFWAWVAGLWFIVFPHNIWAVAFLDAMNSGIGLIGAWNLSGCFLSGERRVVAIALLLLTPLYTFLSFKYNANSIFLSLWPWTAFFFVRAIERNKLRDAILFGTLAGLDMLSKYYAVLLLITCLAAALMHPACKRFFHSALPWTAIAVAALVFVPHAVWLAHNNYLPIVYLLSETGHSFGFLMNQLLELIAECVAYNILAAALVMIVTATGPRSWFAVFRTRKPEDHMEFLLVLALLPAVLTLVFSVLLEVTISENTMVGIFCLMPVVFLKLAQPHETQRLLRTAIVCVGAISATALAVSPVVASFGPRDSEIDHFIAKQAQSVWKRNTQKPLLYISGAEPWAEEVIYYIPERPQEFINYSFADAPWVTRSVIREAGFVAICPVQDRGCLAQARAVAPGRIVQQRLGALNHWGSGGKSRENIVIIAALPPNSGRGSP